AVGQLSDWIRKHPAKLGEAARKTEVQLVAQNVPAPLAQRIALLPALGTALNLARLAVQSGNSIDEVTEIFFGLGQRLGFDWLIERAQALALQTPWQREALALLLRDLTSVQ